MSVARTIARLRSNSKLNISNTREYVFILNIASVVMYLISEFDTER